MMSRNSMEEESSSIAGGGGGGSGAGEQLLLFLQQQQQRKLTDCEADDHDERGRWLRRGGSPPASSELVDEVDGARPWSTNIYENLIGTYGKLRKCEENIYENICEDCGRLYGAGRCGFCAVEDEESDRDSETSARKFRRKYSAKFQEFLGKFPRIRARNVADSKRQQRPRPLSKSDIVHNAGGFEDVFRTNKSFDLGEICRMRDDERGVAGIEAAGTDDDGEEGESELSSAGSGTSGLKVKSLSANLIDLCSGAIYENLTPTNDSDDDLLLSDAEDDDAVNHWMTSLRSCVESYEEHECDRGEYHVKSIPSVTFNDVGEVRRGFRENRSPIIPKFCESDLDDRIAEFRLNWENNQRKRRFSAEDDHLYGDPVLVTFGSVEFEEVSSCCSSAGGTLTPGSVAIEEQEDRSEKVEEEERPPVISPYRAPQLSLSKHYDRQPNSAVCELRLRLQKFHLDVSLCRVVLTYERWLKVFVVIARLGGRRRFNKRDWYRVAMTNRSTDSTGSALQDSVRIDQYFQFLEANETMLNRLEDFRRRRRRKGELLPNPDPEVQSNSSSTSGVHSDLDCSEQQNNIYQHIWTCKTEPNPEPVYEEAPSEQEHIYEYIRLDPPRDDSEWEVVDDFAFSKQLRPAPPPVPNRNIRHPLDHYRNVCILLHPSDPRVNRIVYNYRRDYVFDYRAGDDESASETSSFCSSCGVESSSSASASSDDEELELEKPAVAVTSTGGSYSIPDCVQYWKFMLLNVNYNDDEEDVIMTEKTIAVIADNVDNKSVPVEPPPTDSGKLPTPPIPIASQLHSPKFYGPAVIRSPSKSQIPASDSPVGTYKSNENLADGPVTASATQQLDKEKSPTPKRERLRDKMKAVLPLSSSWSSGGSGNQDDGLVFGVELDQVERDDKLQVPRFVTEVVEILKEPEFIETSGLYRASGNKNSIEGIKKKLNEKRSPKKYEFLKKQDVHSLTGSLKLFFRELKSPLIARDVYEMCVQKTKDEAQTIENIKFSLEKMELINRNTLRYLIRHLRCVHQNSDVNMMNSSNLAIVWGACLFASTLGLMESYENNDLGRINTLVRQLIDHYDKIFYSERRID